MKKCVLGEFADLIPGVSYTPDGIAASGIRILRGGNINSSELQLKEDDVILSESYQCKDNEVHEGDTIVVASSGSADAFGKAATSWVDLPGVQIGAFLRIVRPRKREYAALVSAWVTQPIFQRYIGSVAKGTGINNIRKEYIEKYPINVDDSGLEQFSELYESICKKIALNRKRIATLEAMAKEIYDYWFVQFDFPDAHGRPYKSSGGAMVYNPDLKREIPKGWCCDNLLRISKLIAGGTPRKDRQEYWNGTIPFFGPTDAAGDIFQLKTADTVTQEGLDHSAGALMSENTVIITARGSIGKMVVCGVPMTMNQSCFAFEEVAGRYEYLYFMVKELIQYLLLKGNGTTFKSIVTIDIENSILCLADDATIDRFTDRVRPLFASIKNATKEIEKLSSLRDFLLPLLMNGQVKVG